MDCAWVVQVTWAPFRYYYAERHVFLWLCHVPCTCKHFKFTDSYLPYDPPQLLTLVVPWHGIDEYNIVQKILKGEVISRPEISEATSDVTDARWNHIEQCLSVDPSARPSAFMAMKIFKCELEALAGDVGFMTCFITQGLSLTLTGCPKYIRTCQLCGTNSGNSISPYLEWFDCNTLQWYWDHDYIGPSAFRIFANHRSVSKSNISSPCYGILAGEYLLTPSCLVY
jgi:hypothetical protein